MDLKLENKVALITGASKGIGKAIALVFAEQGAKVAVNYHNSEKQAKGVEQQIKAMGREVCLVQADVSNAEEIESMIQKIVNKYGRIDILVNNAGIFPRKAFLEYDSQTFDKVLGTNLKSMFFCSQAVAKQMLNQENGLIINIASDAGITPKNNKGIPYGLSKSGMIYLSKCLSLTLAPKIRVNCIAPGYTETDMTLYLKDSEIRKEIEAKIPSGRVNQPKDIADLALSIVSDYQDTGKTYTICGGDIRTLED
ncbi:MAG: 3-oxoacyl-ACP reductase family protein [Nanoarchaeota archaeon]|nr:3-oxoacyl-ACP reductase FabG [Nanoarchaeota archaeon]